MNEGNPSELDHVVTDVAYARQAKRADLVPDWLDALGFAPAKNAEATTRATAWTAACS